MVPGPLVHPQAAPPPPQRRRILVVIVTATLLLASALAVIAYQRHTSSTGATARPPAAPDLITVGTGPSGVAVDAGGHVAYVTNSGDGTVSVIDTTTGRAFTVGPLRSGDQRRRPLRRSEHDRR